MVFSSPRALVVLALVSAAGVGGVRNAAIERSSGTSVAIRDPAPADSDIRALTVTAPDGVRLTMTLAPYGVHGLTRGANAAEMYRLAPQLSGQPYSASTRSNVRWTYRFSPTASPCAVQTAQVEVSARVIYPTWEPVGRPAPAEVHAWNAFRRRLLAHERGHVALAVEAAAQVVTLLHESGAAAGRGSGINCGALGVQLETQAQGILQKMREREETFDRTTQHGMHNIPALRDSTPRDATPATFIDSTHDAR